MLIADYDKDFLEVPKEALVHTMEGDQRYFPLYADADFSALKNYFVFVSNIQPADPSLIIEGNKKVIAPRLTDAKFFYEQDLKTPLESLLPRLKNIVFQRQLGTVYDKVERIGKLASLIGAKVNANPELVSRAALLSKADLMTNMVFEFTDTQGIMGKYYALKGGENPEVAQALFEQYLPRFSGDILPTTKTGAILSVADKLDTLVGIFGIDQAPKAAKDPFALRRASIAILRILSEVGFDLDLAELIDEAILIYGDKLTVAPAELKAQVLEFVNARVQGLYQEEGYSIDEIQAIQALGVTNPLDFKARIEAVHNFKQDASVADLAAANKRVKNFLSKNEQSTSAEVDPSLFTTQAEVDLYQALEQLEEKVRPLFAAKEYEQVLFSLVTTREVVNKFFEDVIINADDPAVRNNRYALLNKFYALFSLVADISALNQG